MGNFWTDLERVFIMFLNNSKNQINPKLVILHSPFLSAARHVNILLGTWSKFDNNRLYDLPLT